MNTEPLPDAIAYSVTDAASRAGVGRSTLYNAISAGELPARKLGKRTLVLRSDLDNWSKTLPNWDASTKTDCPANRTA
ncbi:helix-turn-helix domain-containing protein [Ochrobactrum sp. A-1]|uniref:helix-turn-helix domain-containing protein n=1 Tax=Ochrobactrum sp. A-1 TaxID=2920940 RepID=UPI001F0A2F60|nr:helix-turn-helix domain-containing protein [Ochrobactrum sp. A-1]